ncbi:MAG: hypothetical protein O2867_04465 [Bacteroidetes bacterium]|nr:hypothetical protein [Bacteroidota bacterium]
MKSVLAPDRAVFLVFLVSVMFMGYAVDRSSFAQVLLGYSLAFAAFFHLVESKDRMSVKRMWIYALTLRLILLFSIPKLSNDYFRFIWDGLVQWEGMSPFAHLPSAVQRLEWAELYMGLNSKDYYSVYPPVMQSVFRISTALSGTSILGNLIFMRAVLILADVLLIKVGYKLLELLKRSQQDMVFFALNPLVILECTGNLHFEGMMMAFALLGIYMLARASEKPGLKAILLGGIAMTTGVLTKLTSLLAFPVLVRRIVWVNTLLISVLSSLVMVFAFWPLMDVETLHNMASSLDLYFRNFQFNSSLYNVVDALTAKEIPHYRAEIIGPWIAGSGALFMGLLILFRKAKDWTAYMETFLFVLSIHLLFASAVHPWYIVNLLAVSLFTRFRYPVVWSFTAVLSYQFYGLGYESPFLLVLEYLPVIGYAIWEFRSRPSLIQDMQPR